ncbi:HK97-gp10 family putative phage morphogenesis protein [Lentzea guizhouensis]|nr:HK97-gp10 family putative phage morphogenesis protein [Lentzea guizhouensis]
MGANLKGDKQLLRDVAELQKKIIEAGGDAVEAWGEDVKGTAQNRVPIDSGNLGSAIESRPDRKRLKCDVGVWEEDAYYAEFVEQGTQSMYAQPFLVPAFEQHADVTPYAKGALAKRLDS